jgi:NTE family protein
MSALEFDKVDAVFEGGGVKGIGLVGAVEDVEARGVTFHNVAGTSAGAIVAALVAAGYSASQLRAIMEELDFRHFKDRSWSDRIPLLGPALSLLAAKGLYQGAFFEQWMRRKLLESPRRVRTFGDLRIPGVTNPQFIYRLQVIAADLTRGRMMVLPRDIRHYGMDPDGLDVAWAVRMSMSIPLFFQPVRLQDGAGQVHYVVDGGVLSNYPVELLDNRQTDNPAWPTIGFKLVKGDGKRRPNGIHGPVTLLKALLSTMMEAHDERYIEEKNFQRTIAIPTLGVRTTDFDLSREKSWALYEAGQEASRRFFEEKWSFREWVDNYRTPTRPQEELGEEASLPM